MFDAETSVVPCDYDVLLMEFAANSQGLLKDMKVWMDAKEDKSGNYTYKYTVTALAGNKAFIIRPEDIGDQTASFIFGEPLKVEVLVKKYGL